MLLVRSYRINQDVTLDIEGVVDRIAVSSFPFMFKGILLAKLNATPDEAGQTRKVSLKIRRLDDGQEFVNDSVYKVPELETILRDVLALQFRVELTGASPGEYVMELAIDGETKADCSLIVRTMNGGGVDR